MNDDLQKDPLESLFSDQLNQDREPEAWDTPGDQVWQRIEQEVVVKNRRSLWPWGLAISLLLLLLLRTCMLGEQLVETKAIAVEDTQAVEEFSSSTSHQSFAPSTVPKSNAGQETSVELQASAKADLTSKHAAHQPKEQKIVNTTQGSVNSDRNLNIQSGKATKESLLDLTTQQNPILHSQDKQQSTLNSISETEVTERGGFTLLTPLPSQPLPLLQSIHPNAAIPVPPNLHQSAPLREQGGTRRFYAGIFYAPAIAHRNIVEPDQLRRRLLKDQSQASNVLLSGGIRLRYQLAKNWSLETGLQLTKTTVDSRHRALLNYDRNREVQNANGDFDSNYELVLSTSFGDIATDVALTRSTGATIPSSLTTFVFFDLQQEFTQLRIPIAVRYERGRQIRWSVRTGLSANFMLDQETQISRIGLNRAGLRHRETRVVRQFEGLNNLSLDYLIAFGVSYHPIPSISFMLEPSFIQGLTPTFEKATTKTYPNLLSLNIGVNYHF